MFTGKTKKFVVRGKDKRVDKKSLPRENRELNMERGRRPGITDAGRTAIAS
jgi:hypothetical protein